MSSTGGTRGVIILLLTAAVVYGQQTWGVSYKSSEICALNGSTVEINCTYKFPKNADSEVDKEFWFIRNDAVKVNRGVTDSSFEVCAVKGSTLKISCNYTYGPTTTSHQNRFCSTAMENDQRVDEKNTLRDRTEYHCDASVCTLSISNLRNNDSDEYEFKLTSNHENAEHISSVGVTLSVTDAPRLPSVSVNPTDVIVEGTSMSLNCSSDANPAANYSWIKKKEGQSSLLLSREPYLFFSSIKSTDSGDYHCTAESDLGRNTASKFIKVQYAPRLPTLSVNPTGVIVEGTSVRLTCSSDAEPPASYNWYKKKNSLLQASGRNFIITNTKPDHSGHYYCEARNRRGHHNSSIHLTIVAVSPQAGKIAIIGIASVIFPAIILSIFLLLRKKRPKGSIPESGERPDNSGQCQRIHQERQDNPPEDIHYASVRFLRNQTDPIYCNIRLAGARKPNEEDYESVEYATVNFTNMSSDPRTAGQSGEDPASLYSVVNKIQMNS
ncbi:B-cell receptor CD22-like [Odontesthes bonariensis]|uniref:B-cell receptor CD22-like n=1 Tax=Odontesthes bonariensis TaxID=219752 RepID=UPI003F5872DA